MPITVLSIQDISGNKKAVTNLNKNKRPGRVGWCIQKRKAWKTESGEGIIRRKHLVGSDKWSREE